ncbi:MAG: S8 family serine peptidase [Thermoplasmata archaeon]
MSREHVYGLCTCAVIVFLLFSVFSPCAVSTESSNRYGEEVEFPYPGDDWAWRMIGTEYSHEIDEYGEGVRIAVLDTEIDYNHPELEDKMWEEIGYYFVDDDPDPMDEQDMSDQKVRYYGSGLVNAYRAAGGEVPTPLRDLEVDPSEAALNLSWEEPWSIGSSQLDHYRIYRGTEEDDLEPIEEVGPDQLYYEDCGVENDTTYYSVTAYNEEGESLKTQPVNATLKLEVEGDLPSNLTKWDLPIIPSVIIISGSLLFILFALALYRREKGLDR